MPIPFTEGVRSLGRGLRARQGVALVLLSILILALAAPLLQSSIGADPTFCCRSGRCCCDPEKDSSGQLDLKAACRCARPDGTAIPFTVPPGLLAPGPALSDPSPAESVAPCPVPFPRDGEASPPDQPPRLSRIT